MACPASGEIKISDIVAEFGGSAPHALSEYYRNGGEVPGNNTNVPTSGEISLTDFYSAVNEIQQTYSSTTTNLNLSTVFGSNWTTTVPKRVIINSGVTIGATSGNAAILIPSGMAGTLVIDNSGNIQGHGGAANGGAGGNAVSCVSTSGVTINNNSGATIKAGGGGGGQGGAGGTGGNGGTGGTGGTGKYDYVAHTVGCFQFSGNGLGGAASYCQARGGDGRYQNANDCAGAYYGWWYTFQCLNVSYTGGGAGGAGGSSGGAGGAGGAGGVGQGYNQSATNGSSGGAGSAGGSGSAGASGGTNAGNGGAGGARGTGGQGGTGGNGGTFGNSGTNGGSGSQGGTGTAGSAGGNGNHHNGASGNAGSAGASGASGGSGGAAGYYITNRGSITLNNSGTVAGQ